MRGGLKADQTGFEPVISSVTGRRVNRATLLVQKSAILCRRLDSNQRPRPYEDLALPLSYAGRILTIYVAGPGIAPGPPAYETGEILLLYPAMIGLRQYPLIILQFRFPVKQMDLTAKKATDSHDYLLRNARASFNPCSKERIAVFAVW